MRNLSVFRVPVCILVVAVFLSTGCATIMTGGGNQRINISSDPTGADIKIYDSFGIEVQSSETPTVAILKKADGFFQGAFYRVVIEKEGYKTQEVFIESELDLGWYVIGNFFIGGLVGWVIVDPLTGAMWVLKPENVDVDLSRGNAFLQQKEGLMIVLKEDIPTELFEKLNLIQLTN